MLAIEREREREREKKDETLAVEKSNFISADHCAPPAMFVRLPERLANR